MEQPVYCKIAELAETQAAVERSIAYMTRQMGQFLRQNEKVLLCFPKRETAACRVAEKALEGCGCTPIWLDGDNRWMTILKTAFMEKCSCIMASPLILLGLSKLSKQMGIPLYVRNVLMSGYPTTTWLVEGVRRGLDCMAWGCFDPGIGAVIGGFTCQQLDGVHIRTEEYGVDIEDDAGNILPMGKRGRVVLYPREHPSLRFAVGDLGKLTTEPCSCGCRAPKLVEIDTEKPDNFYLSALGEGLLYWSSILDCRVEKTECGLELELVVFPGEKLPKLPTAAKLTVRDFDPDKDAPFEHDEVLKKRFFSQVSH